MSMCVYDRVRSPRSRRAFYGKKGVVGVTEFTVYFMVFSSVDQLRVSFVLTKDTWINSDFQCRIRRSNEPCCFLKDSTRMNF